MAVVTRDSAARSEIRLYGRAGCHLCDEARRLLDDLLAARSAAGLPTAPVTEIDIETDAELLGAFLATIPVVEVGALRLELATSPARLRRLLAEALDGQPATAEARAR